MEEAAGAMGACEQLAAQLSQESWVARGAPGTSAAPRGLHQRSSAPPAPAPAGRRERGGVREGRKGERSQRRHET